MIRLQAVTESPTVENEALPWGREQSQKLREEWHVVVAWSLEEPWRVGETAMIRGASLLGRGGAQPHDPCSRLVFYRRRPDSAHPCPPLAGARISRQQLELRPAGDDKLEVASLGRCALSVDGVEAQRSVVAPGAVLTLKNALILYVMRRPPLERLGAFPAPRFAFGEPDPHGIVGEGAAAWRLRDELAMAARSPHHVLLRGESGAGKELAARAIHALSGRAARPFVSRNAATFPEGLVDAELFGNVRNYPQSGTPERPGLVGEADGSTLFLDELAELPQALQAHLLRLLDPGGEYQRLGDARPRRADLRLVAATNRPLDALKHDLLARFASRIEVPPLQARREDVPLLARHLLLRFARDVADVRARLCDERDGEPEPRIDPKLVEALLAHEFTHHLRELERLLWLAVTTTREPFVALTSEVQAELRMRPEAAAGAEPEPDADAVREALAHAGGSVTRAARALGLKNRFSLYRLMKRHGIDGGRADDD
jgi:two-component system nitrogen regulation response regulator GlnG/two-component system response regulator HydG